MPTPIGNLQDITVRALKLIETCAVILCEDKRVVSSLLSLLHSKGLIALARPKLVALHSHNEKRFLECLSPSFFEQDILYMSDAGMPCVSDPGAALICYAQQNDIPYTVLPGASAALSVFVASGSLNKEFLFYGFLPHKQQQRRQELFRLFDLEQDVIMYESPHRLFESLKDMAYINSAREIFIAKEMTKHYECYHRGSVQDILIWLEEQVVRGEWAILLYGCKNKATLSLNLQDVESLGLPPKIYAKIIAKMQNRNVKECYREIIALKS